MFGLGFLSRKLGTVASSSGTADPASIPISVPSPESEPPITPSPPPQDLITDPNPLHALIASVPPQTLHAYTLAHLIPPSQPLSPLSFPHIPLPSEPPSPRTLTLLTNFFAALVPPPRLHCTRCHKGYFEVENSDRSCLVPHDDESAEVERVGAAGRGKGIGTEYETLWGCCGKTVEGDGDMGPPDGWCYEGKHTTDIKRARFRADSTLTDDKLVSCQRLRCHEPPSSSPRPSRGGGTNKRRRALMEQADGEDAQSSVDGSTVSGASSNSMSLDESTAPRKAKRARHSKSVSISSKASPDNQSKDEDVAMDVDPTDESKPQSQPQIPATPKSPPRPRKSRKSAGGPTTPGSKIKAKAKSPLASSFTPPSPPAEDGSQPQAEKTKAALPLPRAVVEITTERDGMPRLGASVSTTDLRHKSSNASLKEAPKGDGAQTSKEKPKSKARARRNTVADTKASISTTPKPNSKMANSTTAAPPSVIKSKPSTASLKPKSSSGALKSKPSVTSLKSAAANVKPPSSTLSTSSQKPQSRVSGRKKGKGLGEVVSTSVEGEENL